MKALINIGKTLSSIPTKEDKSEQLTKEINKLNFNLPARVWLPLLCDTRHCIVRIPPQAAAVLNSKDKVSFSSHFFIILSLASGAPSAEGSPPPTCI